MIVVYAWMVVFTIDLGIREVEAGDRFQSVLSFIGAGCFAILFVWELILRFIGEAA